MSLHDYVEKRSKRDPGFEAEVRAATAELDLGEAMVRRRDEWNLSLAQLAESTGIAEERLEAIEAGDSMTVHEMLWLLHALELSVTIDAGFNIDASSPKKRNRAKKVAKLANTSSRRAKATIA